MEAAMKAVVVMAWMLAGSVATAASMTERVMASALATESPGLPVVRSIALFADFFSIVAKVSPIIQMVLCVCLIFCVVRLRSLLSTNEGKNLLEKGKQKQRNCKKENP